MKRKATIGRKRMHLLSNLVTGKYVALKRTAEDRKELDVVIRRNLLLSRLLEEEEEEEDAVPATQPPV